MAGFSFKLARRYAKALFESVAPADLTNIDHALSKMSNAWETSVEFRNVILNPALSSSIKEQILKDLVDRFNVSHSHFFSFLTVLLQNGRFSGLAHISQTFSDLVREYKRFLNFGVASAFELSDSEKNEISTKLKQVCGSEVSMSWIVDPSLLGGLSIRAGDRLLDGSIRASLERISAQILSA